MKKTLLLTLCITAFSLIASAQLKQGKIVYEIKVESPKVEKTDSAAIALASAFLSKASLTIYFAPGLFRSDFEMMIPTTTIYNYNTQRQLCLQNLFRRKIAIESPIDTVIVDTTNFKVTSTQETKVICGYNCSKVQLSNLSTKEKFDLWITREIEGYNPTFLFLNNFKIDTGFVLMIKTCTDEYTLEYIPKSVETTVKLSVFDMTIPEGYEKADPSELQFLGQ